MGAVRVIGEVVAPSTAGWRTPIYTGPVTAAVSFSIKNGIATIVLGANNLPKNGYNGPNGYPAHIPPQFDIYGGNSGQNNAGGANRGGNAAGGQQVTLWGFAATYFNGCTITVLDNDPTAGSFRFYFNHADVNSTDDAGNTASAPSEHYRAVRLECEQGNSTNIVYVGDLNVSASKYMAALSLEGQLAIIIASDNIPADRIFIFGSSATNCKVQVSLIY